MAKPHKTSVTPDELRRAFTILCLAMAVDEDWNPDDPSDSPAFQALERQFGPEKADAMYPRVAVIMMWRETEPSGSLLVDGESLLGVPEIHPAVYDVAATLPFPSVGIPNPAPFMRALEKRLQAYDLLLR